MQNEKIIIQLTKDQFSFLKELAANVAFELSSISDIRPGDKKLLQKAILADEIEQSFKTTQITASPQV